MKNLLTSGMFIGIVLAGSNLSGSHVNGLFAGSPIHVPMYVEQEVWESVEYEEAVLIEEPVAEFIPEEIILEEVIEVIEVIEAEELVEVVETIETEELTYDQLHQRDVGEVEEVIPPEISQTWYVPETAASGLAFILETYDLPAYSFIIESTPSNYVYQYDFYADSPEGDHTNLVGMYQYDATGNQTFRFDLETGSWE